MNLIHELGSELAVAVLVEKKHAEKISSGEVVPLISRIKDALQMIPAHEESNGKSFPAFEPPPVKVASH